MLLPDAPPIAPTPGTKLAAEDVSSSNVAIRLRASNWLGPAPGTRAGMPTPETAAFASTSTHAVNWAHATHTASASTFSKTPKVISCRSMSGDGMVCGSGHPMK